MKRILMSAAIALTGVVVHAQDVTNAKIETTKVGGSVYMLVGMGGNIGVSVGEDGIIMIDDQYAPLAPKIKAALAEITSKPVKFIVNTHWHGDHTGGNEAFGESAPIVAHTNVRKRMQEGADMPGWKVPRAKKQALPVVTFGDRLSLHLNGEDVRVIHFPNAHTDGDSVIFFTQSNVVHMGDNFFNGMFPFIDLDSGGSVRGTIAAVEKALTQIPADAKIIPGHGPLATVEDLRGYLAMLKETSGIVSRAIKAGKSVETMKSEKILAKYETLSWRFISTEKFIATLDREYRPMKGKGPKKK